MRPNDAKTETAPTQTQNQAGRGGTWHELTDDIQLTLAREALRRAADTLADHAELLADEMDAGTLFDQGGPDALRLFAAVIRTTNKETFGAVGHA